MKVADGHITGFTPAGMTVFVPASQYSLDMACLQQWDKVQVGLPDGRTISPEQRRKAYAIMGEIAAWAGYSTEEVKLVQKRDFIEKHLQGLQKELFSLSNCDMTTAREFISYLIDFVIEFGVPTKTPLAELCEDVDRYVYACLTHKVCAVCGKHAGVHHVDRVGAGRNRNKIIHEGMLVMPLCWGVNSHHALVHTMAQEEFDALFHIHGIPATKEICKIWGLKYECE